MGFSGDTAALKDVLTSHRYDDTMIPDEQAGYLATFLASGLDDMNAVIEFVTGDAADDTANGDAILQTTCAAATASTGGRSTGGMRTNPAMSAPRPMQSPGT